MTELDPNKFTGHAQITAYLNTNHAEVADYFERCHEVIMKIIEVADVDPKHCEGYWKSGPNPFYGQLLITDKVLGMALCQYYSSPYYLCTPFGQYSIGSANGKNHDWFRDLRDTLKLTPLWGYHTTNKAFKEGVTLKDETALANIKWEQDDLRSHDTEMGCFGPVWQIGKDMRGNKLSKCRFSPWRIGIPAMSAHDSFSYEAVKELWKLTAPKGKGYFDIT